MSQIEFDRLGLDQLSNGWRPPSKLPFFHVKQAPWISVLSAGHMLFGVRIDPRWGVNTSVSRPGVERAFCTSQTCRLRTMRFQNGFCFLPMIGIIKKSGDTLYTEVMEIPFWKNNNDKVRKKCKNKTPTWVKTMEFVQLVSRKIRTNWRHGLLGVMPLG